MILVDTSVWIDHFRKRDENLVAHLNASLVLCHPMVVGEIALGNLKHRAAVLQLLQNLPVTVQAENEDVLNYVTQTKLASTGIGLVDVHLLLSAKLSHAKLWTRDKRLAAIATDLNLAWSV